MPSDAHTVPAELAAVQTHDGEALPKIDVPRLTSLSGTPMLGTAGSEEVLELPQEQSAVPPTGPPVREVVQADLQKEIDAQMRHMRLQVARSACAVQEIVMQIDRVGQDISRTSAPEVTDERRTEWVARLQELATDIRTRLSELEIPTQLSVPEEALHLSLRTTGQLTHAKRLHDNLLAALRSEAACRQKLQTAGAPWLRDDGFVALDAPARPAHVERFPVSPSAALMQHPEARGRQRRVSRAPGAERSESIPMMVTLSQGSRGVALPTGLVPSPPAGPQQGAVRRPPTVGPSPSVASIRQPRPLFPQQAPTPMRTGDAAGFPAPSPEEPPAPASPVRQTELNSVQLLSAGLYLVLEALLYESQSERAMIFKYQSARDELQAVSCCGAGLPRAGTLRMPPGSGLIGAVFSSKVAVNVSNAGPDVTDWLGFKVDKIVSLLAVPIFSPSNRTLACGVLLLMNKHRGNSPYEPVDESTMQSNLRTVSYFLERYPVDVASFDPSMLHSVVPLKPQDQPPRLVGHKGIEQHRPQGLVFRTIEFGVYMRKQLQSRAEPCPDPVGLKEVVSYIQALEQSWDESIRAHLDEERNLQGYLEQSKVMREQLKRKARRVRLLKDIVRTNADENIRLTADLKKLKQQPERSAQRSMQLPSVFKSVVFPSV
eukprot:TRINITY_DN1053_c0_g5_i1.p1 TRINITY_DN1053_c0_g5~~TRINITY_DN1053_c0_g5_i1.p1  ORF type:complete len:658 (+),score=179.12 TRINITY_DN1053_c0_g5_i1:87-2060(+)